MPALLLRLVGEPRGFGKFVEASAPGGPGAFFHRSGRGLDLRSRAWSTNLNLHEVKSMLWTG